MGRMSVKKRSRAAGLKGTATLMISMFNMKELSEPSILIPVSSKSFTKYGSYVC